MNFCEKYTGVSPVSELNKILCVGMCVLDIIHTCKEFPLEDSDQRSVEYRWQRGGNASNTSTVLSLLGSKCEFLGILSAEEHFNFLKDDMRKYNIDFSHCPTVDGAGCPTSSVILSLSTGSRTIVHHNPNQRRLTAEDFQQIDLNNYDWIHFEGRNPSELLLMLQRIKDYNDSLHCSTSLNNSVRSPITITLEFEKWLPGLTDTAPYPDVLFISKELAEHKGFADVTEALEYFSKSIKHGASIICAWGDKGAAALSSNGKILKSPPFPPAKVIDTLGAGDTFNAAVLHYLNKIKSNSKTKMSYNFTPAESERGDIQERDVKDLKAGGMEFVEETLQNAITFGCRVAGAKVGIKGYSGLKGMDVLCAPVVD